MLFNIGERAPSSRSVPKFTYDGNYELVTDSDEPIADPETYQGSWKLRLLTSGTLTISALHGAAEGIDVFLVGGGGGGSNYAIQQCYSNGGPGYWAVHTGVALTAGERYPIVIGAGGYGTSPGGGATSAFTFTANGGGGGTIFGSGAGGSVTGSFGESSPRTYCGRTSNANAPDNTGNATSFGISAHFRGGSGIVILRNTREVA